MDKTKLVAKVKHLFELAGHRVQTSVQINFTEIDLVAEELQGLVRKKFSLNALKSKRLALGS